ncbi:multidrug resistance protein 1, partial [Biomphalaria glabrata]
MMKSYKLDNSANHEDTTDGAPALIHTNNQNGVSPGAKNQTGKKKKKKDDKGEKSDKEVKRTATFGELYSFSTCCDKFLIFLGFLMAMAHGASWPLLFLIFGNMTNDFIN